MSSLSLYTDGASKGNPGPGGIGIVIVDPNGTVLREVAEYVGTQTNNAAEYLALIRGLAEALDLGATEIEINTDSELLACQLAGVYRVKSPNLQPLHAKAMAFLCRFRRVAISHVPREFNKRADELANEGIKKHTKQKADGREQRAQTPKRAAKREKKAQGELGL